MLSRNHMASMSPVIMKVDCASAPGRTVVSSVLGSVLRSKQASCGSRALMLADSVERNASTVGLVKAREEAGGRRSTQEDGLAGQDLLAA